MSAITKKIAQSFIGFSSLRCSDSKKMFPVATGSPFHQKEFEGKVALVVGGCSGVGLEIARTLAEQGANVAISSRTDPSGSLARALASASSSKVHSLKMNIVDEKSVENGIAEIEKAFSTPCTILVNATVERLLGKTSEFHQKDYRKPSELALGFALTTATLLRRNVKRGERTNVINIIEGYNYRSNPYSALIGCAHDTIISFTSSMCAEAGRDGLRINCINMPAQIPENPSPAEEMTEKCQKTTTLIGRPISHAEIANATAFFLSDMASSLNGMTLHMDGGQHHICPSGIFLHDLGESAWNREKEMKKM